MLPAVRQRRRGDVRRRTQGLEPVQDRVPSAHLGPRLHRPRGEGPLRGGLPGRQRAEPVPQRMRPHLHARVRDRVHARQRGRAHRHRRHQRFVADHGAPADCPPRCPRSTTSGWRSWAAAPQGSPPPASWRSSGTRRPCLRLSPSPAACCVWASPSTACHARRCRTRSTASPPSASSSRPACAAARTSPSTRCWPTATTPSFSRPACTRARTCRSRAWTRRASCAPSSSCARRRSARSRGRASASSW